MRGGGGGMPEVLVLLLMLQSLLSFVDICHILAFQAHSVFMFDWNVYYTRMGGNMITKMHY